MLKYYEFIQLVIQQVTEDKRIIYEFQRNQPGSTLPGQVNKDAPILGTENVILRSYSDGSFLVYGK